MKFPSINIYLTRTLYLTLLCIIPMQSSFNTTLLDANALQNTANIQAILELQGFKKVFFTTPDNLKLCGLLLDQSKVKKIKGTIVYCAGFYPGTKEGMSSFYALLADQPYNFFIFDARGHQESQGSLFSYQSLKHYGTCEFYDIVAVLNFLNSYNQQHNICPDIIIHAICSGAFHAIKAINYLQTTNNPTTTNVKGVIFDSGWLRLTDIIEPTICAEVKKRLQNSWFSWLITPVCFITLQIYKLTLKSHYQKVESIASDLTKVSCPVWFVHCTNDPYVPIQPVQNFTTCINCPNTWWIAHDSHANFHMLQPEKYKMKMLEFLAKI
jgi:pimeloyl-ACP methyl ester carboxylesterase